ncbi:MAG: hypothetical protein KC535_04055 [Nanoarchaeota archaeon]|nr:hypothetical protein [Nanoarchaeota archaeon]
MAKHTRTEKASIQGKGTKSFNLKKTFSNPNLKKYFFNEKVLILILILIPMLISTHYRMQTSDLDITQQWALDSYKNQLRVQVAQQINTQYPNLPEAQRDQYITQQLNDIIEQQKDQIQPQLDQTAEYFKSRMQDENGNTYLLAIDPYLWLTEAENYVEHGYPGDVMTAEGSDLSRRNGREPSITSFNFHPWLGAQLYRIGSVFDSTFTVQRAMFLLPAIIIALSIIPAFFLGRKIGGNLSGFVAGLLVALNTSLLSRTPAGFSDTDAYIIFFPLLISWAFMEAITTYKTKNIIIWTSISAISYVLFTKIWGNGWHIAGVALGVAFIYFLAQIIRERKLLTTATKKNIFELKSAKIVFVVILFLFGILTFSYLVNAGLHQNIGFFEPIKAIFLGPLSALSVKAVASTDVWPNVLTTVAELNEGSWSQIISSVGGKLFFIMGILGVLLTLLRTDSKGELEVRYVALLGVWFIGLSLAGVMSSRFIALLAAPFAIAFGSAFGILFTKGSALMKKQFHISGIIPKALIIIVLIFLLSGSFTQAKQVASNEVPSMTDAWYESLTSIRDNSTDGIITSWWDFGHWFVNIAQRRVTFDGGGQGKRIYWVGKALMTTDLEENKDILRMLNCGQEEGYDRILESVGNSYRATNIITTITYQNREQAAQTLLDEGVPTEDINSILEKTHCSNEELLDQYFIVSQDMIGKAGVWAHFGGWNFTKANIYNIAKNNNFEAASTKIQELGYSQDEAEQFYFDAISLTTNSQVDSWISPWPSYITSSPKNCVEQNGSMYCDIKQTVGSQQGQQIVIDSVLIDEKDPSKTRVKVVVVQGNQIVGSEESTPVTVSLDTGMGIQTTNIEGGNFPYEIVVVDNGGQYQAIIADPLLARSAFTMMFYFNGKYMDGYEKISDKTTFTGQRIIVYKVDLDK